MEMHVGYYDLQAFQRKHGKLLLLLLGIAILCLVSQQGERQDRRAPIFLTSGSHDFSSPENRIQTQSQSILQLPVWSPVVEEVLIAYSAHWDTRALHDMEPPYVRILATILNTSAASELVQKRMACRFYFGNGSAPVVVPGKMILHEPSDHSENAIFILCPARHLSLEQDIANLPQSVVIQAERSQGPYTYEIYGQESVRRFWGQKDVVVRNKLAVCVRPFFGPYDNARQLIEFLLYYTIQGVSHFTFFNTHGMTPNVAEVIKKARTLGFSIDILPWNCQYRRFHLHAENQYMAINACLYWHMPFFEYSAIIDIDEYISYRGSALKTLPIVLDELEQEHPDAAAYLFRHMILSRPENVTNVAQNLSLPFEIFLATERQEEANFAGARSKTICRSDRIITSTIHTIGEPLAPYRQVIVPPNYAGLFHVRKIPISTLPQNLTTDLEMRKYYEQIERHPFCLPLLQTLAGS